MHKFDVGQAVVFQSEMDRLVHAAPSLYKVTKHLPERDGEFHYIIRRSGKTEERVALESELGPVFS
jgi:hypothetical protein